MDRVWLGTVMPPGMPLREERSEGGGQGRAFPPLSDERHRVVVKAFERFMGCLSAFTMKLFLINCSNSSRGATATSDLFVNKLEDVEKVQEMGESLRKLTAEEAKEQEDFHHFHTPLPSLPILRALGLHSSFPNVVLARFHCLRLVWLSHQTEERKRENRERNERWIGPWMRAWREEEEGREGRWEEWVLSVPEVASSMWGKYLRERSGKWGRIRSVFPQERGEKEEEDGEDEEGIRLFPWEREEGARKGEREKMEIPAELELLEKYKART